MELAAGTEAQAADTVAWAAAAASKVIGTVEQVSIAIRLAAVSVVLEAL